MTGDHNLKRIYFASSYNDAITLPIVVTTVKEKNNEFAEFVTDPPPSTEMDIELDILHKGTPKHEQTAENDEQAVTPQYEYEYEYVYYDDYPADTTLSPQDDNTVVEQEDVTTTSKTSLKSLLSFLNRESTTFDDIVLTTQRPAIFQSSTIQYDMVDSYPELRRSTVTVEIEDDWSR